MAAALGQRGIGGGSGSAGLWVKLSLLAVLSQSFQKGL